MTINPFLSLGTVLGASSTITASVYAGTRLLIKDVLKISPLPLSEVDEVWDKKVVAIIKSKKYKDLMSLFARINPQAPRDAQLSTRRNFLQSWCFDRYEEIYWSAFTSSKDELLNDVREYCTLKIEEKIDEKVKVNFDDEQIQHLLNTKIEKLKNYPIDSEDHPKLSRKLRRIRNSTIRGETDGINELKSWCVDIYQKGYQGNNTMWKLTNEFCVREQN